MRYVTFLSDAGPAVGILEDGQVLVLADSHGVDYDGSPVGLLHIIAGAADGANGPKPTDALPLNSVTVLAPIPRPRRNIFCVGQNYRQHSLEFHRSGFNATTGPPQPERPVIFTKSSSSVIGPCQPIGWHPELTQAMDYEAELAVIIGPGGRGITAADAMDHVWGYTILNDVTARDMQRDHRQWFLGKSLDGFCPMGPWAVTADEVDVSQLLIECWVNDELRQQGSTSEFIFDIPDLIAVISAGITLEPGDVIATGTPAGVGVGFDPPRFLRPCDRVRISITGLGTLQNSVAGPNGDSDDQF